MFTWFLYIPCLYLTSAHHVTTHILVKIGYQSLSLSCYISFPLSTTLFYSTLEKSQSLNQAFLKKSFTLSDPWTWGTQLFFCVILLLVFNYFISNYYIYTNSIVCIILQLSKFLRNIRGVTLVPFKTQSLW